MDADSFVLSGDSHFNRITFPCTFPFPFFDTELVRTSHAAAENPALKANLVVRQWSRADVQEWLKNNELTKLCDVFKTYTGKHLESMYSDYISDKAAFRQELKTDFDMDGKTCREFIVALADVFG